MPSLTIRNIPENNLRWLRARAGQRDRSLNTEVLDVLAVARADDLAARRSDSAFGRSLIVARRLGVRTPASSSAIVRRDRARNDRP